MVRASWMVPMALLIVACGNKEETDAGDADADIDVDVDVDSDADTDTSDPGPQGWVRILNLVVSEPAASLFVDTANGAVVNLAPVTGSVWRRIGVGMRTFSVGPADGGKGDAWSELDVQIGKDERFTLVSFGADKDIRLLSFQEQPNLVGKDEVDYKFLNAAPELKSVDLWDVTDPKKVTAVQKGLMYGFPVDVTREPAAWKIGVDIDDDGTADAEYDLPDLGGGVSLPIYLVVDAPELLLVGQAPQGAVQVQKADVGLGPEDTGAL